MAYVVGGGGVVGGRVLAAVDRPGADPGPVEGGGRQGAAGRGEPGSGSRCRQTDVGGLPGRPDLDGTQNVQIRSSFRVDNRQVPVDQIESGYVRGGSRQRIVTERVSRFVA